MPLPRFNPNRADWGSSKKKPGHRAGLPAVTLSPNSLRANHIDETNGKACPAVKSTWVALNTQGGVQPYLSDGLPSPSQ
jgi:hypothetical protein